MWTKELFGTDVYHLVSAFIIYSVLGWFVESIYMSFCNRRITNRGFAKGPFCPIYGFGGVVGYLILHPLAGSYVKLYFAGAILATVFEFLVGKLMVKLFGELWWDYNDKPCNYKGIICLESTIAWGFYAVIIICFLNGKVMHFIDVYSYEMGVRACKIVIVLGTIDFTYQLLQALHFNLADSRDKVLQLYEHFKTKWN
ncbi:MAG: putative ABC transporter permease [Lachnospiraceae bacterium]|nr:putative ABC transporter permease [Lachnospiraceae bacterium]